MDELVFVDKVRRIIKMRHDDVVAAMVSGGVDNMEKYQYMLGQLRTYQYMSQEISSLLEKKERKDDGTVISIKPKEVPKYKAALKEKYDKEPKKKEQDLTSEHAKLPIPTGWRILVLPFKMKDKTKGGILITDDVVERSQVASTCGLVLEVGPDAYKDKERYPKGPWCKKGTWVVFARYAGSRIKIDGGEVRLLNDDEVLATVENPEDIFHDF